MPPTSTPSGTVVGAPAPDQVDRLSRRPHRSLRSRRVARVLALLVAAALTFVVVPPAQAASSKLTLTTDTSPRQGEAVWFTGVWSVGGKGTSGKQVVLQFRKSGSSTWQSVGSTRSTTGGKWTVRYKPESNGTYRARAEKWGSTPGAVSSYKTLTFTWSPRDIDRRVEVLGWRAGTRGFTKTVSVPGTSKVRYDSRSTMLLVEVTQKTKVRTWIVEGEIRDAYTSRGSATGQLGYPLSDARCGLLDGGCLQRFSKGVVYDNGLRSPVVVLGSNPSFLEVSAVARSQVGYAAPSNNISRYNTWVGTSNAWCSIFLSWVGAASAHTSTIATYGNFPSFHSWATQKYGKKSQPRIGAIVFYDTHLSDGVSAATHAGLVIGYSSSSIYTIEGNTSNPSTGTGRGVYYKTRPRSMPMYYVYPTY